MTNYSPPPPPPDDHEISTLFEREMGEVPLSVERLKSGAWSSALAVSTGTSEYVLRLADGADDFHCDAHATRYAGPDLPIPTVHGIGRLGERWWCISDRMPGVHLDDLRPDAFEQTLPSVAKMLVAMRMTDSENTSGYGGWDENGNGKFSSFAEQLLDVGVDTSGERGGGWSTTLRERAFEQRIFNCAIQELTRLCQYVPNTRQLIHQDTIKFNVTVVENQISGVFDWGCAMWGDALYDLAWFRFWDPWYPERRHLRVPEQLEPMVGIEGDFQSERLTCYLLHIGLMHIRYNAFIGDPTGMNDVARETKKLLDELP